MVYWFALGYRLHPITFSDSKWSFWGVFSPEITHIYLSTGKQDSLQTKCLKYILIWFSFIKIFKIVPSLSTVNSERKLHWQEAMKMLHVHVPNENQCSQQTHTNCDHVRKESPEQLKNYMRALTIIYVTCWVQKIRPGTAVIDWLMSRSRWIVQDFKSMVSTTAMLLNCSHYLDYSVIHMKLLADEIKLHFYEWYLFNPNKELIISDELKGRCSHLSSGRQNVFT